MADTSRSLRRAVAVGLVLGMTALSCTPEKVDPGLTAANTHYAQGNFVDALAEYRTFAAAHSGDDDASYYQSRLREGLCLYRLGQYDGAARAFGQVNPDLLIDEGGAREHHLYAGRTALALARRAEPVFLDDSPENAGSIRKLREVARKHLQSAQNAFGLMQARFGEDDFEALLGKGECFFHKAVLENNRQAFQRAGDLLRKCRSVDPEDKRALFFLGRVLQEDLGRGELTQDAAKLMLQALFQDSSANHDFHVAYRDAFSFLREYSNPGAIDTAFENDPDLAKNAQKLVEYVDRYRRHGRHDRSEWGETLIARISEWLETYNSWDADAELLARNVVLADEALRERSGYLDAYRKAIDLLDAVDVTQRDDERYGRVRRIAQQGYVEALLETGESLLEIDETELAREKFGIALDLLKLDDQHFLKNPDELLKRGRSGLGRVEASEHWQTVAMKIQKALVDGDLEQAQKTFDLAKAALGDRKALLGDEIAQLEKEVRDPSITEYVASVSKAEGLAEKPSEALPLYLQALELSETKGWTARQAEMSRAVAQCYFKLGDHQRAIDAISSVATLGRRPTQKDWVLQGKCYYFKRDYKNGCTRFDKVNDKTLLSGVDLRIAGLCYLEDSQLERSREYLEAAPKRDREVVKGLRECYRELFATRSADRDAAPRQLIDILERLTVIDPADHESRRRLGFLLYRVGDDNDDEKAYRQAFDHIVAASRQGFGPRSDAEKEVFSRLVAYFSDYVPLAAGNRWTYRSPAGATREVGVTDQLQQGRFRVVTKMGPNERVETWDDADSVLKRYDAELEAPVELPIKLRTPTDRPVWRYRVRATKYEARVVATGETCVAGGQIYTHCITVKVSSSGGGRDRFYTFAPGVGEVRMKVGEELRYELTRKVVPESEQLDFLSS